MLIYILKYLLVNSVLIIYRLVARLREYAINGKFYIVSAVSIRYNEMRG